MTARHRRRPRGRRPVVVLAAGLVALAGAPALVADTAGTVLAGGAAGSDANALVAPVRHRVPSIESVRLNPVRLAQDNRPAAPSPAQPVVTGRAPERLTTTAAPGSAAAVAIEFALAQLGLPYVWGGDGPQQGDAGFDCSGLTHAAYAAAGIDLPRTAHTQYYAGPHVPAGAPLEPGDLVFYGVPARVHHVGLYLGNGRMVNAPTFGRPVRIAQVRYRGDDYLGATRPAAGRDAPPGSGLLNTPDLPVEVPPIPAPDAPAGPEEFPAPPAPVQEIPAEALALAEGVARPVTPTGVPATPAQPASSSDPPPTDPGTGTAVVPPPSGSPEPTPSGGTADPATPTDPNAEAAPATPAAPSSPATGGPDASAPPPDVSHTPGPTSTAESTPTAEAAPTTEPAPPTAEAAPAVQRPVRLALPGGTELALSSTERGDDGLPIAPSDAGGLRWDGDAGRGSVALPAGTDVAALVESATLTLHAEDGTPTELTVTSVETTDAPTAADLTRGGADDAVLVLVLPADDGTVLVVTAA